MAKLTTRVLLVFLMALMGGKYVFSQYSFGTYYNGSYQALDTTTAIPLLEDSVWTFGSFPILLAPLGFNFTVNNSIAVDSVKLLAVDGMLEFFQQCGFPPSSVSGTQLAALFTGLVDRGNYKGNADTAYSRISYLTEGTVGTRVFKAEWKNTAFSSGDWYDWANFQVWLYETSNILEIHYGASNIQDTLNTWTYYANGPLVTWAYDISCATQTANEAGWVYGYRNNPSYVKLDSVNPTPPLVGITSVPDSGIVYRFTPWALGINEATTTSNFVLYPNPTTGLFSIKGNYATPAALEVFDMAGKQVLQQSLPTNNGRIDASALPGGLYIYRITTPTGRTGSGKLLVR